MAEEPFKVNPMLIQYLTGLSNDLSAYGADTSKGMQFGGINKVTNDNIKAQGFMKLLKQAMGPDSSKVTIDGKGIGITAPNDSELFKQILGDDIAGLAPPPVAGSEPVASAPAAAPAQASQPSAQPVVPNPFMPSAPNLNVNPTDLAGLTPENIMAVIGAKQQQDQIKLQSYRDLVDSIYKGSAMGETALNAPVERRLKGAQADKYEQDVADAPTDKAYKEALTNKAKQDMENDRPIYQVPDSPVVLNAKDWIAYQKMNKETQTADIKNFEYAQQQGFTGGLMDFKDAAKTTHKKDYDEAVKTGYKGTFNTWLTDMAKAGAINLGDLMHKESELTKLQGEKYFANPDWTTDLQRHIGSKDIQNRISDVQIPDLGPKATKEEKQKAYRDVTAKERAKVNIEFIEGKIAAGGGKVIANPTMDKDGKTVTWKVQWPTGNITEVKQAIR